MKPGPSFPVWGLHRRLRVDHRGEKKKKTLQWTPGCSPHPTDWTQDEEGRGGPQTMERNELTAWAAHSTICLEPSQCRIPDGGGWSGPQKGLFISLVVLHH